MSAITGVLYYSEAPVSEEDYVSLLHPLRNVSADDIQIWHGGSIVLSSHTQWIVPESINEQLPFICYARRLAITADAIIDNRAELFELLNIEPARRKGMPDSQLILLAYRQWGEDAPRYLIGDFAFMIWDMNQQKLFGARDFSGSRTLYYCNDARRFAFSTTIEPLLGLLDQGKQLNEMWLAEFLAITSMVDAADTASTIYKHVKQLPPSHSISIAHGRVRLKRYCTLDSIPRLKLKSDGEYVEAFQEVFQQAVRARLRTHRQVGAQLSGGLDSGAIVGFAAKALRPYNKSLHTFSYIPESSFEDFTPKQLMPDERPLIHHVVNYVDGIEDHYVDFQGRNSYAEIDDFLDVMEMPYKFFENSYWLKGMFEVAQEKDVAVLLNGGRGNLSISWGDALSYYAILLKKCRWLKLYKELHHYSMRIGGSRLRQLPRISRLAFPILNRAAKTAYPFPELIQPQFAKKTDVYHKLAEYGIDRSGWAASSNLYAQRKWHFQELYHWNASNTLAAKLSLRYSLWKRDPSNDLRVIRFCLSVPEEQYVQNGMDRALIRRSTEQILPDQVRLNQRVRGVQGADWVHRMLPQWPAFIQELQELRKDERMMEYLNHESLDMAMAKAVQGVRPDYAIDLCSKILMRSIIVYRFLKRFV